MDKEVSNPGPLVESVHVGWIPFGIFRRLPSSFWLDVG